MNRFTVFVLGAVGGALAALAFAPKSGAEIRKIVADKAEQTKSGYEDLFGDVDEEGVGEDELRAKIEEARKRIAKRHEEMTKTENESGDNATGAA